MNNTADTYRSIAYKFSIKEKDYNTIVNIIASQVAKNSKIYAFGSRVSGSARQYSDLDLLVYASASDIFKLKIAFEESSLGFNVDVIDANTISPAFYKEIENDLVLIYSS